MSKVKELYNKFFSKNKLSEEEQQKITSKNWLPIESIRKGIVKLKNGTYLKLVEVEPVNFKLKSASDRRCLIYIYRAFLKAARFPMQISVQCKKADVDPHIKRILTFYKTEKNENVKHMTKGYIKLVKSLATGTKGAISRKFFIVFPYISPPGVKNYAFEDVEKQLAEKQAIIKEYLDRCDNFITEKNNTEEVAEIMYNYINKRSCEIQKFGEKLLQLSGTFLSAQWEEDFEEEEAEE